ncbi:13527_t:CDS:1, partial [Gigaspora rosea]
VLLEVLEHNNGKDTCMFFTDSSLGGGKIEHVAGHSVVQVDEIMEHIQ